MRNLLPLVALSLSASLASAAGPSLIEDRAGLFQPETIKAVDTALTAVQERMHVEVRVVTLKDMPAVLEESRPAALADLARKVLARSAAGGSDDLLQIVVCPAWKQVVIVAGPEAFAQRITTARREAMEKHFVRFFAAPDTELPTSVDGVCRELVTLAHPKLTIFDNARLFSPPGVDKAAGMLGAYQGPNDTQLVIETVAVLTDLDPELTPDRLGKMSRRNLERRLDSLAERNADQHRSGGGFKHAVFVMIVQEPPSTTVINYPRGFEGDFSSFRRGALRKIFANRRADRPDAALFEAVGKFKEFQEEIRPVNSPLGTVPALALLGALVATWLGLRVVRRKVAGDRPRLYTPALMGSLFGVPAGAWVYDQLFEAERAVMPVEPGGPFTEPAAPDAILAELPEAPSGLDQPPVPGQADETRDPGAGEPL